MSWPAQNWAIGRKYDGAHRRILSNTVKLIWIAAIIARQGVAFGPVKVIVTPCIGAQQHRSVLVLGSASLQSPEMIGYSRHIARAASHPLDRLLPRVADPRWRGVWRFLGRDRRWEGFHVQVAIIMSDCREKKCRKTTLPFF